MNTDFIALGSQYLRPSTRIRELFNGHIVIYKIIETFDITIEEMPIKKVIAYKARVILEDIDNDEYVVKKLVPGLLPNVRLGDIIGLKELNILMLKAKQ